MSLIKAWFRLPAWLLLSACVPLLAAGQEKDSAGDAKTQTDASPKGTTPAGAGAPKAGTAATAPTAPPALFPTVEGQGLGAFGRMLPVGQPNMDVKIPSFKDGLPSSLVRAGSMTRMDSDNMVISKVDIRLFGPTRDRDVRVQLITGLYHMPSQMLSSEERSRVTREDFQLEGDSMVFDTKTQQGKMVGNVKMVIFDTASFTTQPLKTPEAPRTAPAPGQAPAAPGNAESKSTGDKPAAATREPAKSAPVPAQ